MCHAPDQVLWLLQHGYTCLPQQVSQNTCMWFTALVPIVPCAVRGVFRGLLNAAASFSRMTAELAVSQCQGVPRSQGCTA